ncbi:hypothetical protein [Limnospira sp.]|uniref:hypothetical protein n=1 Tax=Limnospira sp. TaxID=3100384 RepID=UPI003F70F5FF
MGEPRKPHQNLTTPSLADCVGFRDRSTQPTRVRVCCQAIAPGVGYVNSVNSTKT